MKSVRVCALAFVFNETGMGRTLFGWCYKFFAAR
jgi:hypothetical protein